ncbi:MAG: PH domain-containing protein [Candidatus Nanohalobium sp.]
MSSEGLRGLERKVLFIWFLQVSLVVTVSVVPFAGLILLDLAPVYSLAVPVFLEAVGCVYMMQRLENWGFELRSDYLFLDRGVLKRTRSMVPYVRVQHVDTQRGPFYRLLGLSKVVVYTAGSKGADVTIPGLFREDAARIQEKLRDLAIESEDMDAV